MKASLIIGVLMAFLFLFGTHEIYSSINKNVLQKITAALEVNK